MAICARDKRDRNEITGNIFHITFHCFIKSKYEESKEGIKGRVEIVLFVCNLCVKFFWKSWETNFKEDFSLHGRVTIMGRLFVVFSLLRHMVYWELKITKRESKRWGLSQLILRLVSSHDPKSNNIMPGLKPKKTYLFLYWPLSCHPLPRRQNVSRRHRPKPAILPLSLPGQSVLCQI